MKRFCVCLLCLLCLFNVSYADGIFKDNVKTVIKQVIEPGMEHLSNDYRFEWKYETDADFGQVYSCVAKQGYITSNYDFSFLKAENSNNVCGIYIQLDFDNNFKKTGEDFIWQLSDFICMFTCIIKDTVSPAEAWPNTKEALECIILHNEGEIVDEYTYFSSRGCLRVRFVDDITMVCFDFY